MSDTCTISENEYMKLCKSDNYNFFFDKKTGYFARWGKVKEEDPQWAPGNEILDLEIVDKCAGVPGIDGIRKPCAFCYKSNGPIGDVMSFDTFKSIVDKLPKTCCQIAFGADAQGTANPDMFKMMEYCRSIGIVPNVTLADISDDVADNCARLCGAVSVSRYDNKDVCYNSIKRLTDRGMKQVNMHFCIHNSNFLDVIDTLRDIKQDERLQGLNAIVFLSLKQKGRGKNFKPMMFEHFKFLIDHCLSNHISFGMDSCSANKFLTVIKDYPNFAQLEKLVEPCESTAFSAYVDCKGMAWPCSFAEGHPSIKPISVLACEHFSDIWYSEEWKAWRANLLSKCRSCPMYTI